MSNYPDDIHDFDNAHGSPFFEGDDPVPCSTCGEELCTEDSQPDEDGDTWAVCYNENCKSKGEFL